MIEKSPAKFDWNKPIKSCSVINLNEIEIQKQTFVLHKILYLKCFTFHFLINFEIFKWNILTKCYFTSKT